MTPNGHKIPTINGRGLATQIWVNDSKLSQVTFPCSLAKWEGWHSKLGTKTPNGHQKNFHMSISKGAGLALQIKVNNSKRQQKTALVPIGNGES